MRNSAASDPTRSERSEVSDPAISVHNRLACDSLLEYVGDTPLIRLRGLEDDVGNTRVELYARAKWFNPGGSVKDRAAVRTVSDAEKAGLLTREKTILESTSGNAGIALAMIGAAIWGLSRWTESSTRVCW
ncbi:MAG: pyridoxal-phosphate dependent enzyme [Candidatus Hydrogenedentota bacterium]|nr:MAG: pyridoxal-phosphate dependent enzyme [Candidatus Hydrogenedentota bacterium]